MENLLDGLEKKPKKAKAETYSAKDIEVLEGLEPVRKRPGMYIGGTDEKALHHLAAEVLDNAMDEVVAGFATEIHLHLSQANTLTIRDNGRGIPVDPHPRFPSQSALEVILTTLHSGGKFSSVAYQTAGGLHGVGVSVVNALSSSLTAEVIRDSALWRQTYERGVPTSGLTKLPAQRGKGQSGTSITFTPDSEIFEKSCRFRPATLYKMARSRAYLYKGVRVFWSCDPDLATSSVPSVEEFYFPEGIVDALSAALKDKHLDSTPFFQGESTFPEAEGRVEWVIAWVSRGEGALQSYCNTVFTASGGTHEQGLRQALGRGIRDYAELTKNKRAQKITLEDIFARCVGVLSVFIKDPQFQGQTKEKLASTKAIKLVEGALKDQFDHWLAANLEIANNLLESMIEAAELREKHRQERELRKSPTQKLRLPGKLADCSQSSREGTELFLVEGDSAGGSAKSARDRFTQAILPLRGKILNVAHAGLDKMRQNEQIQNIEMSLGCGIREGYKEEKLRYEKVIIMTDADVDGAHIASLLMTYFYFEMRPLILNGHLYLAEPPLYRLSLGDRSFYVMNDAQKEVVISKEFHGSSKVEVGRFKGLGEMNANQLKETTMDPKTRSLTQVKIEHIEGKSLEELEKFVEDLMGKKPEMRFEFIQKNAQFAKNLDI